MSITNNKKQKGFTLIEMMVSVALFSIVMTAALGAIITLTDSNKKARSLMSVMTNLNFAVDSVVRSFKVGDIGGISSPVTGTGGETQSCLTTNEIDYATANAEGSTNEFIKRQVVYCFEPGNASTGGKLTKQVAGGSTTPITSPDVNIKYLEFDVSSGQPRLTINMSGTVKVSPKISSDFSIQTTVSQRKLNR